MTTETTEQLSQLAERLDQYNAGDEFQRDIEQAVKILSELVKQQEPVACVADFSQQVRELFLADGYNLSDPLYANPAIPQPAAVPDFEPDAKRLALELECLLLSCTDNVAVSKWWDSAHEALEQHRQLISAAHVPPAIQVSTANLEQAAEQLKDGVQKALARLSATGEECEFNDMAAMAFPLDEWNDFEAALSAEPVPPSQDDKDAGIAGFKPWLAIHLKTGNEYRVIGEAIDATNMHSNRPMVIYRGHGQTFVRCAEEFVEKFQSIDSATHVPPSQDEPVLGQGPQPSASKED